MISKSSSNSRLFDKLEDFPNIVDRDDITIVIPTLNEEEAIGHVIENLFNEGYDKIFVIDGYSSDETTKIARQYKVIVLNQHGKGKTGAIKTAIEHVKTKYMVIIDGDFTYDAKDIDNLLLHIKYYNEVIGTRKYGRDNIKPLNRFGNWMINKLFNLLFGTNISDVCSGLYALRMDFAKQLVLDTTGFDVEVEIAAQAASSASITEVPISYGKRLGVQKLNPFSDGFKIILTIIKMARIYNPLILYSLLAGLTIIPAFFLLGWIAIEWINGTWHSGIALFAVMLALLSSQAIIINVLVSQQKRMEQRLIKKFHNL